MPENPVDVLSSDDVHIYTSYVKKDGTLKKRSIRGPGKDVGGCPVKYRPEYCQMLIEHMSRGGSYSSFGSVIKVSSQTLYNWEEAFPAWKDARGMALCEAENFYINLGLDLVRGKFEGGNAAAWKFLTKNLLKWREQFEVRVGPTAGEAAVVDTVRRMSSQQRIETVERLRARRMQKQIK